MCTQPCYFGGPFALNWASDDDSLLDVAEATLTQRVRKRGIATRYYTPAVHNGRLRAARLCRRGNRRRC